MSHTDRIILPHQFASSERLREAAPPSTTEDDPFVAAAIAILEHVRRPQAWQTYGTLNESDIPALATLLRLHLPPNE